MSKGTLSPDDSIESPRLTRHDSRELALDQVRNALEGLRYGEVRLVIQDGILLQIERVEKHRLR